MALFGSKNKEVVATKHIRPTVIRVQNVAKELVALAKSYNVRVDSIDFNILEVQTYTRMSDGKETEWEEISQDEIYELGDEEAILNPHFQIKQMYEVEFFSKQIEDNPYKDFNLAVGANATKCKVYLSIKEGSKVSYSSRFEQELTMLINKSKVRAGILINIFDEMLPEAISKISAHVRVEEDAEYTKNETILIAESYEPTLTVHDELVLHYDKKDDLDDNAKADYASRGFIESVKKDELLIEYIKAKIGKPGRNCRGEFMEPKEPEETETPTFTVDETIREEDTPKSIQYFANENGYIKLEGTVYGIKKDVDLGEISFKTTGNITSGLDSDVSLNVKEADAIKDAIGNGMEIEVSEIDIEGNVGSNAKIWALKATVGGQVHKTAELRAEKLDINIHKGIAYGKNIKITRLEHGTVDGDVVNIAQAIGGKIKAKEINIEICASHVTATASRLIEIKKLHGSENTFIIDPLVKRSAQEGLDDNSKHIQDLELDVRDIKKEVDKHIKLVKDNTASFIDVKKRLINYKKNGIKMPESFVKKYKQFNQMQEHLKNIQETYSIKEDQLKLLTSKISSFQDNILDARIINRDHWSGYNELIFKLVDPEIDISYKPAEGCPHKVFGLVELEDGSFEIQAVEE